jgi:uncharacterized membrane protein YphA (DoxX/SURF4 family)
MGALAAAVERVQRLVAADVSARPVAILRMVVGLNVILCGVEAWGNLHNIVRPGGLRVPFAPWLEPPPAELLTKFMVIWFTCGALLAVGLGTRVAGLVVVGQLGYTLLLDQQTYSNHLYLLTLEVLYLLLGNAGACWSLDARLRGGAGAGADSRVPAWPVTLWKWQISIVYFFAAAAKLNPNFLSGGILEIYWPTTGWLGFLEPLRTPLVLRPLAVASVAAEFFLAFALWLPSLRRLAVIVGVGLHAGMILMVWQKDPTGIIVFALASVPPYLLFFIGGTRGEAGVQPVTAASPTGP